MPRTSDPMAPHASPDTLAAHGRARHGPIFLGVGVLIVFAILMTFALFHRVPHESDAPPVKADLIQENLEARSEIMRTIGEILGPSPQNGLVPEKALPRTDPPPFEPPRRLDKLAEAAQARTRVSLADQGTGSGAPSASPVAVTPATETANCDDRNIYEQLACHGGARDWTLVSPKEHPPFALCRPGGRCHRRGHDFGNQLPDPGADCRPGVTECL